jgi:hypothetical protein
MAYNLHTRNAKQEPVSVPSSELLAMLHKHRRAVEQAITSIQLLEANGMSYSNQDGDVLGAGWALLTPTEKLLLVANKS